MSNIQLTKVFIDAGGLNQRLTPVVERSDLRVLFMDMDPYNKAWAILVEVGFLSNTSDAQKLATVSTQQAAGYAIADAIKEFVNNLPPIF